MIQKDIVLLILRSHR